MRTEVVMPQMGESVAEGTLTKWLKTVGQTVERDEPLFELTTDKVDADVPSPVNGVLVEIHVQPGQTVEVNAVVAIIDTEAAAGTSTQPANGATAAAAPVQKTADSAPAVTSEVQVTKAPATKTVAGSDLETLRKTKSTPLVRKIAAEHGIANLAAISGSGVSGRVTKKDILAYIASGAAAENTGSVSTRSIGRTDIHLPPIKIGPRDRVELMSPQRQRIAEHMIASRATSAHAQTVHELDFSNVAKARKKLKAEYADRGVRLTYTAFIMNALAQALKEFPLVNASVDGDHIVFRGDINIGVAVDTGTSLIVPVIKNCDELNLQGTARAVNDVADRARNKKLRPEDVQDGTFTLTNPGIFGSEFGVPILNQPQAAILATGAIKKRVVVDQKTDAIMVKPTSVWCMSFDHRIVDGATADRFISRVREIIENWEA